MKLLDNLGTEGINFYKNVQLRLDMFYPLGFMLTYSVGCLWCFEKISSWRIFGIVGAVASFIAGIADYIENISIYRMLSAYPEISPKVVSYANAATVIKSLATTVAMIIFIFGLFMVVYFVVKNKLNR
ncbi:MAG: hypothetical protein HQL68_13220 [Magnetococcales bacterium]|nr:hypothetical protein [Magnetococcales bacterium]